MRRWAIGLVLFLVVGCFGSREKKQAAEESRGDAVLEIRKPEPVIQDTVRNDEVVADTPAELEMRNLGLVDIQDIDSSIRVHLIYATPDNFVGKILYRDICKAFMLPETARRLADAQRRLKNLRPGFSLIVYDAARSMAVQQEMWELVRGTDKRVYVSNPKNGGGLHNYGAAVDVTVLDSAGVPLPMGCDVDYFGNEARPDCEETMLNEGKIILPHLHNRRLLRRVMTEAGFRVLPSEWWHFNLMSREEARKTLQTIQ